MLIASRLHFTPPPLIAHTLCTWHETGWGEGITTMSRRPSGPTTVSLHLFICRVWWLAL